MGEVVNLSCVTKLDLPAARILEGAASASLADVVIVGQRENGEFYFAGNKADAGATLWLLAMAQKRLLQMCEDNEPLSGGWAG